jgi:cell division protein FtsA
MADGDMVVGLDLGTTKVCVVIAELTAGDGLRIIGVGHTPSEGLRRGVVVDVEKTVQAISKAIHEAELMAGVRVDAVITGITGEHIDSRDSSGAIGVGGQKQEITVADRDRVIEAARAVAIPFDREVLHVLPQGFSVDDRRGIRDPVGMFGVRLETRVHIVTASVTSVKNICKSVQRADIEVSDVVLEPLASSRAVLGQEEREMGVCVVDVGGGTTDIAVFDQGSVRQTAVIGLGGQNVTSDIAICLRTGWPQAELIKCKHGAAREDAVQAEDMLEIAGISGRAPTTVSRAELAAIIEARMEEVFSLVYRELRRTPWSQSLGAGVVLTGGGCLIEGTVELAEQVLEMPVRLGVPRGNFRGLEDRVMDPAFSTAMGLVLTGVEGLTARYDDHDLGNPRFEDVAGRMKGWLEALF